MLPHSVSPHAAMRITAVRSATIQSPLGSGTTLGPAAIVDVPAIRATTKAALHNIARSPWFLPQIHKARVEPKRWTIGPGWRMPRRGSATKVAAFWVAAFRTRGPAGPRQHTAFDASCVRSGRQTSLPIGYGALASPGYNARSRDQLRGVSPC